MRDSPQDMKSEKDEKGSLSRTSSSSSLASAQGDGSRYGNSFKLPKPSIKAIQMSRQGTFRGSSRTLLGARGMARQFSSSVKRLPSDAGLSALQPGEADSHGRARV
jgi:hypothetical protein